jgi:Proline-rich nuclear receptor coactivator motif
MSTPPVNSAQTPRRSPRRPKKDANFMATQSATSNSEPSPPALATKTASQKPNESQTMIQSTAPRKKSQASKKHSDGPEPGRQLSYGQTSAQPNGTSPSKKATPLKQAYAGPTFHSSPAASSLPMPSFYSKSLPTVAASPRLNPTTQLDGEGNRDSDTETLLPVQSGDSTSKCREPSPLDFMFEAARKARDSPKTQSPDFRAGRLSPFDDISRTPSRTPGENSAESVFPFELDGNGGRSMSIGPSFATPYKERLEALRSPKAQSTTPTQDLDEKERKEKSEALKRLLINASQLRSPHNPDVNSYFPERAFDSQSATPNPPRYRHHSGPSTPQPGTQHAPVPRYYFQNIPAVAQEREPPVQRPVSSHLRREYQPNNYPAAAELDSDSGTTPPHIRTASQNNYRRSVSGQSVDNNAGTRSHYTSPPHHHKMQMGGASSQSHSAQKLEEDIRRVLKLDLTSTP